MSFDYPAAIAAEPALNAADGPISNESGPDGEAAAARQARRDDRLARLAGMREMGFEIAGRLTDMIAGRLPDQDCEVFAHIQDPTLAFSRLTTTIGKIIALEDRLDESDEARAARLAAEQAARDKADRKRQAQLEAEAAERPLTEKKHLIHRAVDLACRDRAPAMSRSERELVLHDLIVDYRDFYDYSGDPAEIVAELCVELERALNPPDDEDEDWSSDDDDEDDETDPERAKAKAIARAQSYLDAVPPRGPPDG